MGGYKGVSETTIRYPDYVEEHHGIFLDLVADERAIAIVNSPYDDYEALATEVENALFGAGYIISDFPSLYDMFGKFMAGLDVDALFDQIFADSTSGAIISNLISEHASMLSDDLENDALPRFVTGLRDINSVMSSTFVVGKAMMETQREKEVSKFSAELKYRMIPVAVDRWKTHLNWNTNVVKTYLETMNQAVDTMVKIRNQDIAVDARDILWPLEVLKREGTALGALTEAQTTEEALPLWKSVVGTAAGIASVVAMFT